MPRISSIRDIEAIEAKELDAYLPDKTPYGISLRSRDRAPVATAIGFIRRVDEPRSDEIIT